MRFGIDCLQFLQISSSEVAGSGVVVEMSRFEVDEVEVMCSR